MSTRRKFSAPRRLPYPFLVNSTLFQRQLSDFFHCRVVSFGFELHVNEIMQYVFKHLDFSAHHFV
jgi:hypothetical protein